MDDKSISPILHSMNADSAKTAQRIVGSSSVPEEEALLLAKMHTTSAKKRTIRFVFALSIIFVLIAVVVFSLPDNFFTKKDTDIVINKNSVDTILRVDGSYQIPLPAQNELADFINKSFSGSGEISEVKIVANGNWVPFKNLAPFLDMRFVNAVLPFVNGDYMYGFVKNNGSMSLPYFMFEFTDRKNLEETLLANERTLYTDMRYIMQLPNNTQNELLQFEMTNSVRNPIRILTTNDGQVLLVYGFPKDDIVIFARDEASYIALKTRLLAGY